jgi:hypothetical protein
MSNAKVKATTHKGRKGSSKGSDWNKPKEGSFCDYNPMSVNPNNTQFEPTDANPIKRAHKQAGME